MTSAPTTSASVSHGVALMWLFAFALLSVVAQGIVFPSGNNVFHLPILLDYAASPEGPHDAFSRSSENFVSYFWVVLGMVTTEETIKGVFAVAQIAIRFATLVALYALVLSLQLGQRASGVAVVILCSIGILPLFPFFQANSTLGRNTQFTDTLSHSAAVVPVACICMVFLIRGRFVAAAAVAGLAFNVNAFVGTWIACCAGLACVWEVRRGPIIALARRVVVMIALFSLCAAPTIWWIFSTLDVPVDPAASVFDFRDYLRSYYGRHNFVDMMKGEYATVMVFCGAMAPAVWHMTRHMPKAAAARLFALFLSLIAILWLGAALPYLTGSRLLLNLYPLRMDSYLYLLLAALMIAYLTSQPLWQHLAERGYDNAACSSFVALAVLSLANGNLMLFLMVLCLGGITVYGSRLWWGVVIGAVVGLHALGVDRLPVLQFQDTGYFAVIAALQCVLIVLFVGRLRPPLNGALAALTLATLPLFSVPLTGGGLAPLLMLVLYGVLILTIVLQPSDRVTLALALVFAGGTAALTQQIGLSPLQMAVPFGATVALIILAMIERWPDVQRPAFAALGLGCALVLAGAVALETRNRSEFLFLEPKITDLGRWVRDNTPPNSLILPVNINGFSAVSRRPIWVDWKVGAVVMWEPALYSMWNERHARWRGINTLKEAVQTASIAGAAYIVFQQAHIPQQNHPRLETVYADASFWVARVLP